jgi:hypothetical protein
VELNESNDRRPDRRKPETGSLFGLATFRPGIIVVLVFLTATVAVFAVRIFRDTGYSRIDSLAREGLRLYGSPGAEGGTPLDPVDVEKSVAEWTGATLLFPREGNQAVITSARKEKVGRRWAAAIRFHESENVYLLLVVRTRGGVEGTGGLFSGAGFLSGETKGKSFVYWERDGAAYFLVTSADLTSAIELVRRYFT